MDGLAAFLQLLHQVAHLVLQHSKYFLLYTDIFFSPFSDLVEVEPEHDPLQRVGDARGVLGLGGVQEGDQQQGGHSQHTQHSPHGDGDGVTVIVVILSL